jgi:hypothetical protein
MIHQEYLRGRSQAVPGPSNKLSRAQVANQCLIKREQIECVMKGFVKCNVQPIVANITLLLSGSQDQALN